MARIITALLISVLFVISSLGAAQKAPSVTVYPNEGNPGAVSCDGDVGTNFNQSYAVAHSVADCVDCSGAGYITAETSVGQFNGATYYSVIRGIVNFDTSFLGAGATINSAVFSIKSSVVHFDFSGSDYVRLVSNSIASNSSYAVSDFNLMGSTALANDVFLSTIVTNQYANFTLNAAGRKAINKTGVTHFALRTGLDVTNATPVIGTDEMFPDRGGSLVFFYGSEFPGSGSDPKLLINYTK